MIVGPTPPMRTCDTCDGDGETVNGRRESVTCRACDGDGQHVDAEAYGEQVAEVVAESLPADLWALLRGESGTLAPILVWMDERDHAPETADLPDELEDEFWGAFWSALESLDREDPH